MRYWNSEFFLLTAFLLGGCGSSVDSGVLPGASAGNPNVAVNMNSTPDGLTTQAREEQIEAIFAKARELPESDPQSYLAQLRNYMITQPNVVEAGLSDGTVWAYFSDGQPIFVSINRPGGPAPQPNSRIAAKAAVSPRVDSPSELPRSKAARLINLFQSGNNSFTATTPKISRMLTQVGYEPRDLTGSLADYKSLGGGVGLLYIDGHGETFQKSSEVVGSNPLTEDVFALESADLVPTKNGKTDLSQETLGEDLKVGPNGEPPAVIRGLVKEDWVGFNKRAHYFITRTFVSRYMSNFSDHSFVFLNTCYSTSPAAIQFLDALKGKGAGTCMGWSERVHDVDAANKGPLFVDRLLGANSDEVSFKENPAQRPFPVDPVLSWFGSPFTILPGQLQKSGENALLAPSIQFIDVTDQLHLELHGNFGSNPGGDGTVRLGDTVLTYQAADWQPDRIKVRSDNYLLDGEVQVTSNGIKSNRVPLTTLFNTDVSFNPGAVSKVSSRAANGAFSQIITNDVETFTAFVGTLADRHGYRETPGGAVVSHTGVSAASRSAQINSAQHFGTIRYVARPDGGSPVDAVQDILVRPSLVFPFAGFAFSRDEGNGIVSVSINGSAAQSEAHHPNNVSQPPDYGLPLLVGGSGNVTVDSNGAFQGQDQVGTPYYILFTPRAATPPAIPDSVPR